ncbi:MAG: hypothetical protein AMXMBFR48_14700 [Ignavibacteriales bacterium]
MLNVFSSYNKEQLAYGLSLHKLSGKLRFDAQRKTEFTIGYADGEWKEEAAVHLLQRTEFMVLIPFRTSRDAETVKEKLKNAAIYISGLPLSDRMALLFTRTLPVRVEISYGQFFVGEYTRKEVVRFDSESPVLRITSDNQLDVRRTAESIGKALGENTLLIRETITGAMYLLERGG